MDHLVKSDIKADFTGNSAFKRIREEGVPRKRVGLMIDGPALTGSNSRLRALKKDGEQIGKVTSAVFSACGAEHRVGNGWRRRCDGWHTFRRRNF
jgi:aminomethyltransferase